MSNSSTKLLRDKKSWVKPGLVLSQDAFEKAIEKARQDTPLSIEEVKQRTLKWIETQEKR
jgi:hypothetical protein